MSVYERSRKKTQLDTIQYEISMLGFVYTTLSERNEKMPEPHRNLFIEGFLLHYRNIVEFMSGAKHRAGKNGKTADISTAAPQVWAGQALSAGELAALQAPARVLESTYFEDISQFLHHCTERRVVEFKEWDLDKMYKEIEPVLSKFRQLFSPVSEALKPRAMLSIDAATTISGTIAAGNFLCPEGTLEEPEQVEAMKVQSK